MNRLARALVVDDNAINLTLVSYLLQAHGVHVVAASDGLQALTLVREAQFDAVLCDIQMPVMDGLEFARRVRQDPGLRDLPLVALTALAMVGDKERILAAGFDAYLTKPLMPATFLADLAAALPHLVPTTPPEQAPLTQSSPATLAVAGPTVLVLDDTPSNLALKRSLLEPKGYRVLTASDPAGAWRLAQAQRPDLIISDVGMREGSGFDFIAQVKADPDLRSVPFIFLSATHWDQASSARALALGALAYLRRPLPPEELLREIDKALSFSTPRC